MKNVDAISRVTELLAEKIGAVNTLLDKKIEVYLEEPEQKNIKEKRFIQIIMLGVESNYSQNLCNKIPLKEKDEKGNLVEYHTDPPTMIDIKYAVIPNCLSRLETQKILGLIIRYIKDNGQIEVDNFDWHDNNGNPIRIQEIPGMTLEKQMQLLRSLGIDYSPALFYQLTVGINSERKEFFRRVEERKMETVKKKE